MADIPARRAPFSGRSAVARRSMLKAALAGVAAPGVASLLSACGGDGTTASPSAGGRRGAPAAQTVQVVGHVEGEVSDRAMHRARRPQAYRELARFVEG